jgi:hypothetical protein
VLHSNEKLRVFAAEASRSEKLTETYNYSTEVSVQTHETFDFFSISPKFSLCVNYLRKHVGDGFSQPLLNPDFFFDLTIPKFSQHRLTSVSLCQRHHASKLIL